MKNDEFDKLFKYMQEFRRDVENRFDMQDAKIEDLQGAVAELSGQIRDYHQEFIMLGRKVDRLERLIAQLAQETGVKLDFLAD